MALFFKMSEWEQPRRSIAVLKLDYFCSEWRVGAHTQIFAIKRNHFCSCCILLPKQASGLLIFSSAFRGDYQTNGLQVQMAEALRRLLYCKILQSVAFKRFTALKSIAQEPRYGLYVWTKRSLYPSAVTQYCCLLVGVLATSFDWNVRRVDIEAVPLLTTIIGEKPQPQCQTISPNE